MLLRERQSGPSGEDRPDSGDDAAPRRLIDRVLGPDDGTDPRRRAARRGVIGVLAGALIMLIAATALAATGQAPGVLGVADQQPSAVRRLRAARTPTSAPR